MRKVALVVLMVAMVVTPLLPLPMVANATTMPLQQIKTACILKAPLGHNEWVTITMPTPGVFKVVDNFNLNGTIYNITVSNYRYTSLHYKLKNGYLILYGGVVTEYGKRPVFLVLKYPSLAVVVAGIINDTGEFIGGDFDPASRVFVGGYNATHWNLKVVYVDIKTHQAILFPITYIAEGWAGEYYPEEYVPNDTGYADGKIVVATIYKVYYNSYSSDTFPWRLILTSIDVSNPSNNFSIIGPENYVSDVRIYGMGSYLYILEATKWGDAGVIKMTPMLNLSYGTLVHIESLNNLPLLYAAVGYSRVDGNTVYVNGVVFHDTGDGFSFEKHNATEYKVPYQYTIFNGRYVAYFRDEAIFSAIPFTEIATNTTTKPVGSFQPFTKPQPGWLHPPIWVKTPKADFSLFVNATSMVRVSKKAYSEPLSMCDSFETPKISVDIYVNNYEVRDKELLGYEASNISYYNPNPNAMAQVRTLKNVLMVNINYNSWGGYSTTFVANPSTGMAFITPLFTYSLSGVYDGVLSFTATDGLYLINLATGNATVIRASGTAYGEYSTFSPEFPGAPKVALPGSWALSRQSFATIGGGSGYSSPPGPSGIYYDGKLFVWSGSSIVYVAVRNATTKVWKVVGYFNLTPITLASGGKIESVTPATVGGNLVFLADVVANYVDHHFIILMYDSAHNLKWREVLVWSTGSGQIAMATPYKVETAVTVTAPSIGGFYVSDNYIYVYAFTQSYLLVLKFDRNMNFVAGKKIFGVPISSEPSVSATDENFYVDIGEGNILTLGPDLKPEKTLYVSTYEVDSIACFNNALYIVEVNGDYGDKLSFYNVSTLEKEGYVSEMVPDLQYSNVSWTPSNVLEVQESPATFNITYTEAPANLQSVPFKTLYTGIFLPKSIKITLGTCVESQPSQVYMEQYVAPASDRPGLSFAPYRPLRLLTSSVTTSACTALDPLSGIFVINGSAISNISEITVPMKGKTTVDIGVMGVDKKIHYIAYGIIIPPVGFFANETIVSYKVYPNMTYVFNTEKPSYDIVVVSEELTYKIEKYTIPNVPTLICENCRMYRGQYWKDEDKVFAFDPVSVVVALNATLATKVGVAPALLLAGSLVANANGVNLGGKASPPSALYVAGALICAVALLHTIAFVRLRRRAKQ